ncbi:MAG: TPM domain-containing protein [Bacteroidota bacterium]
MLFNQDEEARIANAIRAAERGTSGEIRLYVEDYCQRDHPAERAQELFQLFGMYNTQNRNAVLIYLAEKSRQFALWGDAGIHEKVGNQFWEEEKKLLREYLQRDEAAEGVSKVILLVGDRLRQYFPNDEKTDINELPDEIIYG